ncbi:MAG: DUF559 domain-containing protein [Chloroflexi bacterium]|nr:MAG: DUF559 domain-containing protein [Chloroflexota bacterium]
MDRPFNLADARRFGLTRDHLMGASWQRLGGGFYARRAIADNPLVVLAAIRSRLPVAAAFSGATAAWLHGLDLSPCDPVEVTLPIGCKISSRAGIKVRRAGLPPGEVQMLRGLAATSAVRTLADLGRGLPLLEGVTVLDMALHKHLAQPADLQSWIEAHPRYPGIARLRQVAGLAEPATESVMETRLRLLLVLSGLPRPQVQVPLYDAGGRFLGRPDLYYPMQRLGLEYDGGTHRDSLVGDNRRQNRLLDAGYRLLRFTAADVLSSPDAVVALVGGLLKSGKQGLPWVSTNVAFNARG